jgi:2-polyprenyl-6-methoxyphenol hydroxylase-like FAD-dependent oxidoreductase
MPAFNTDILGAGPTGLVLAATLRQAGLEPVVVERSPTVEPTSRAAVVHAHTLETLETIGVSADLVSRGLKLPIFRVRDRDRPLVTVDFGRLPSAYPYLLMLPQDVTERILTSRFTALGGEVMRSTLATKFMQDGSGVVANLVSASGERTIRARYVVGADGMHSTVRDAAGIGFEGEGYAQSFVLADVVMEWPLGPTEVTLYFSPAGLVVVAPLPNGSYRVVATVDEAPEHPGSDDVQAILNARGPRQGRVAVKSVGWSSRFRVHHRLANSYRKGRLFVMGDAAHVHSPLAGRG